MMNIAKRGILIGLALLLALSFSLLTEVPALASPGTIQVDVNDPSCVTGSGQPDPYSVVYCSIQDAIDDANSAGGDTIIVAAGTYNENVIIDKNLILLGAQTGVDARGRAASESIIDAGLSAPNPSAIHVTVGVESITIDGFMIIGSRGAVITEAESVTFINNIVEANASTYGTNVAAMVFIKGNASNITVQYNDSSPTPNMAPNGVNQLRIDTDSGTTVIADVSYNWLHNSQYAAGFGFQIRDTNSVITVTNNEMWDNYSDGMWTYNAQFDTLDVHLNTFRANGQWGIKLASGLTANSVDITCNNIYGNNTDTSTSGGGLFVDRNYSFVNAINNWWGDVSGPYDNAGSTECDLANCDSCDLNNDGTGDIISGNAPYCPWLTDVWEEQALCLPPPPPPPPPLPPPPPPPPPGGPVGITVMPMDKAGLLLPWVALAGLLALGTGAGLVIRRRISR